jgi:hypothetical protein
MDSIVKNSTSHRNDRGIGWPLTIFLLLVFLASASLAEETTVPEAPADSTMALTGGQEGTVFKSLTIEGENRVQISFDRPELAVEIDPSQAPGLTWGSSLDVLNRTVPDLTTPLLAASSHLRSPYQVRPWLAAYETGPVARFTSDLEGVHRWTLLVVDSRGREIIQFTGKKKPPRQIEWDGRQQDGTLALPGLTYSFVLEAYDKAGNKRRFVGDGFQLAAYRRSHDRGPEFLVSGDQWQQAAREASPGASPFLLETASWLVMKTNPGEPVLVTATAGSYAEAKALGDRVAAELRPLLPGDDSRVAVAAMVEPGFPAGGILHISAGSEAASDKAGG